MDISLLLSMTAESAPDRMALTSGPDGTSPSLTFCELDRAASRLAAMLSSTREPVAFLAANSPLFPVVVFAAARAGRPVAPLNYRLPDAQLAALIDRLGAPTVIVDEAMAQRIPAAHRGPALLGAQVWERAMDPGAEQLQHGVAEPDDEAVLIFTSGTTGEPKVVVLRHESLVSYVLGSVEFLAADEDEAAIVVVPPYHIAGVSGVLTATYSGRRTMPLGMFDPAVWVRSIAEHGITHAMVVPTMLKRIIDVVESEGGDLRGLRSLAYGGGPMPQGVIERALSLFGDVALTNAYGLTETSATIAVLTPADHREAWASEVPAVRARLGSVGRPIPAVEVEIRHEDGTVCQAGEPGLLWVRGPQVAGEYRSGSALDGAGWFNTRDRAHVDADGYLFLGGRADDVIVRGGENTSPGEIEDVLLEHPAVVEAAAFGTPDDEWGQQIEAAVVVRAPVDSQDLRAWVWGRLRSTKVPAVIHQRESMPFNEMGKLLRRQLQDEYTRGDQS